MTTSTELPQLPVHVPVRDVRRALGGACTATIRAMIDEGTLPRPIKPRKNMMLFERTALFDALRRMGIAV